jgi:hypothetical protein
MDRQVQHEHGESGAEHKRIRLREWTPVSHVLWDEQIHNSDRRGVLLNSLAVSQVTDHSYRKNEIGQ